MDLQKLEPLAEEILKTEKPKMAYLSSIAISLKRIADMMEKEDVIGIDPAKAMEEMSGVTPEMRGVK